jgi:hypothetical protein
MKPMDHAIHGDVREVLTVIMTTKPLRREHSVDAVRTVRGVHVD